MFLDSELLPPPEASSYLGGIRVGTLAAWRTDRKHLRFIKVGARVFYRLQDLDGFLASRTVDAGSATAD
jgi:hypothetical protein